MMPLKVTSTLESDLIGGLFGCDLDQINEKPNENGIFFCFWRRRLLMKLMLWTGETFFRVEGSTNAWNYSTRRSGAALKDMCLRDILAVNKNCHV
jgi:hypothetical protein